MGSSPADLARSGSSRGRLRSQLVRIAGSDNERREPKAGEEEKRERREEERGGEEREGGEERRGGKGRRKEKEEKERPKPKPKPNQTEPATKPKPKPKPETTTTTPSTAAHPSPLRPTEDTLSQPDDHRCHHRGCTICERAKTIYKYPSCSFFFLFFCFFGRPEVRSIASCILVERQPVSLSEFLFSPPSRFFLLLG